MDRIFNVDELSARDLMTTKMITVTNDSLLSEAIGKMDDQNFHELPVMNDDGRYMGLVSLDLIIKRRNIPMTAKVSNLLSVPPVVKPDDPLSELSEKILMSGIRALPVISGDQLVGIVSRTDIVRALSTVRDLKDVSVESIMSHYPLSVNERDEIGKARLLIRELPDQIIPVVDDSDRLTGVIGKKDLIPCLYGIKSFARDRGKSGEKYPQRIEMKSIMNTPVKVPAGTSVGNVSKLMAEHDITSVIVVEDDKPVGVITQLDMMELIASAKKREDIYVQITGLSEESSFEFDSIYSIIQRSLQDIAKVATPTFFSLNVAQYNNETGGSKYSLRIILNTSGKNFYAKAHGWDLIKATDEVMNILEKMVRTDKEKKRDRDRETRADN